MDSPGHTALNWKPYKWFMTISCSKGVPWGAGSTPSLTWWLKNLQWKQSCHCFIHIIHINIQLYLRLFLKNKKTSPTYSPGPVSCGADTRRRQTEAVEEQLAPNFSSKNHLYFSVASFLSLYLRKNGGLCSSHQLIPIVCSRHGAHHGGQLTANPLFTELAMQRGLWN